MLGFWRRAAAVSSAAIILATTLGRVALAADLPPTPTPGSTVIEQGGAGPSGPTPSSPPPSSPLPSDVTPGDTTPAIPADAINAIDKQAAMQAALRAVADRLGMSTIELMIRLRTGQTLGDIAQERGVGDQEILATVAEAVKPQIDQAVQEGKLTQLEGDRTYRQILQSQQLLHTPLSGISLDQLLAPAPGSSQAPDIQAPSMSQPAPT